MNERTPSDTSTKPMGQDELRSALKSVLKTLAWKVKRDWERHLMMGEPNLDPQSLETHKQKMCEKLGREVVRLLKPRNRPS